MTEHTRQLEEGGTSPPATIESAAFLEGRWVAEALGGTAEETWSPPRAGSMLGMFRLIKDGKPAFYELFAMQEEAGSLVLRLKHFDGESFHGWEEKEHSLEFPLVALEEGALYLSGLTFEKTGPDSLTVYLAMKGKDGFREAVFPYRREGLK